MAAIELTQGLVALVDDADVEEVTQYRWYAKRDGRLWYAKRGIRRSDGGRTTQFMHMFLTGYAMTDHVNGDGLGPLARPSRRARRRVRRDLPRWPRALDATSPRVAPGAGHRRPRHPRGTAVMSRPVQLHLTHAEAAAVVVALGEAWADTQRQHPAPVHGEQYARRIARAVRRLNGAIKAARVNQIRADHYDYPTRAAVLNEVTAAAGCDRDRAADLLDRDEPARPADFKDRP